MSYQLNKTDGTILTDLIDGQLDTTSTNLTLIGKNYSGYGEFFNENFIKLLENFANTAAPSNPLTGQLWWDTSDQRLKVYDGAQWKASGAPFVQATRPQMVAGDLWIDNANKQVFAYDGNIDNSLILLGPDYTQNQGVSGFRIDSILDAQSRSRSVAKFFIGNVLVGVFSAIEFTPEFSQRIPELTTTDNPTGKILQGFNIVDKNNFKWYGTAESANALVTGAGNVVTADQFLPSDDDGVTVGTLTVQNSGGITVGLSQNHVQKVVGPRFYFENQIRDHDISLRVRSTAYESLIVDALYIDASTGRIGIFTTNREPQYTLDVEGDLRVTGNLLVEGDTTSIEVSTLKVEDKNIELATLSDSTLGDDNDADTGGIILKSTQSDKNFIWRLSTNSWTSNVNINLENTSNTYKIGGQNKLTNTSLVNIIDAPQLKQVGTLDFLNVKNLSLGGTNTANVVKYNTGNLILESDFAVNIITGGDSTPKGTIIFTADQFITGVTKPTSAKEVRDNNTLTESPDNYVATKGYTDKEIAIETIVFALDITGLGTGVTLTENVKTYLNDMYPASSDSIGKIARIHGTSYSGARVEGVDVEGAKNISFVNVDSAPSSNNNQPVVQDIAFDPAEGDVVLNPFRSLLVYKIDSQGNWQYQPGDSKTY